jgi:hypothetical protein
VTVVEGNEEKVRVEDDKGSDSVNQEKLEASSTLEDRNQQEMK